MTILITGGTGKVGTVLAARAARAGLDAAIMSRKRPAQSPLPWRAGDLADAQSLDAAFAGIDALFLVTPIREDETELGLQAIARAKAAGVRRILYMSIMNLETMARIPHFASKIPIEEAVKQSGLDWAILRPNHFFQNDLLFLPAITQGGLYPLPLGGIGLSAIDARDIAEAAFNLVRADRLGGRVIPLCGETLLTGALGAQTWSRALDKAVAYIGDDLAAWDAVVERHLSFLSDWDKADLRVMMKENQAQGCRASAEQIEQTRAAIGAPPRVYADFVSETAQALAL